MASSTYVPAPSRPAAAATEDPVLVSKIIRPVLPGWVVGRPRIDKLIAQGARGPLTILTGPPGAGKTMALASWAAGVTGPARVVWITLDRYDDRPKVFWSYVVAALRRSGITVPRVAPGPTRDAVDHEFLLRLASLLATQDAPVVLVLDDFHLVTEQAILDGVDYLLRSARPALHLVISSRMDPLLPLHRFRLAGELTEIRASELAFSVPESSLLLAHHDISLSRAAVQRLTQRTEGWAAGLRLAALSLDGHPDPEQFVKELEAEDSAVTSYLVDEVLNAQPAAVRNLLLRTSILDCVSTDLASEFIGDPDAADMLNALARANAFVQPLGHGWYRYHSLFGAVLRLKLRNDCPDRMPGLHRQAARWYQRRGRLPEAVQHAADAGDWPLAAGIILDELAIGQLIEPRRDHSLHDVFRRMPRPTAEAQPQQLLMSAAVELSDGARDLCDSSLAAAETVLDRLPPKDELPGRLAAALTRLAWARQAGDFDAAARAVDRAGALLRRLPAGQLAQHPGIRAQVLGGRGMAELWSDHLDDAVASFAAGAAAAYTQDSAFERADCLGYLALLKALRGRLGSAAGLVSEAAAAAESGSGELAEQPGPAAAVAAASVHLQRGQLHQAHSQLKLADAALRDNPDRLISAVAWLVAAQLRLAQGRPAAAADMIQRAGQGWQPPHWLELRLTLLRSRACAAAGDVQAAVIAAGRAGPRTGPAAVTLAHARLVAGDHQGARQALGAARERTAPSDEASLAACLVEARLSYETGDPVRGRRSLERALRLARPEQLRLPFAMERAWLRPVLRADPDLAHAYRELLEPGVVSQAAGPVPAGSPDGQPARPVIEPLSDREREVLQHLAGMLSTVEIAGEMYISVNTVKTHLRSIYRKLSVAHRGEAVRRARQLKLL
jgi:LuxR family transcriptional regulator, maltose regulon positive regulatory protein